MQRGGGELFVSFEGVGTSCHIIATVRNADVSDWPLQLWSREQSPHHATWADAASADGEGVKSRSEGVEGHAMLKVKVQVYSLVSSVAQLQAITPWSQDLFVHIKAISTPRGAYSPAAIFWRTELFQHTSLHCPTRYPLTPGSIECTCEQSALPRSTTSERIQSSRGSNPRSLACTSRTLYRWATTPQDARGWEHVPQKLLKSRWLVCFLLQFVTLWEPVNRLKSWHASDVEIPSPGTQ